MAESRPYSDRDEISVTTPASSPDILAGGAAGSAATMTGTPGAYATEADSDIQALYRRHVHDRRRERLFLSSLSFFVTFAATRSLAHAIRNKVGPFRNMSMGGTHIHHSFWGIFSLLAMGYAWVLEIGTGASGSRRGMRALAALYGAGAALTLDEYALWLKLQNDYKIRDDEYWRGGGRKSIYAVVSFGSFLLLSMGGLPLLRALLGGDTDKDGVDQDG